MPLKLTLTIYLVWPALYIYSSCLFIWQLVFDGESSRKYSYNFLWERENSFIFQMEKKFVTLPLKVFKINIIENTEIKTSYLLWFCLLVYTKNKKINHGKFLVEVPEYLKLAAHQCKLQYTKSNLQESVSHVINVLSLNYVLCDNFTFKLANMFLKDYSVPRISLVTKWLDMKS